MDLASNSGFFRLSHYQPYSFPLTMNRNNQSRKRPKRNNRSLSTMVAADLIANPQPPPFTSSLLVRKRFRFVNGTNSGTYTITACKLGSLISMATLVAGTTVVQFFDSVRVISVELWASSNSSNTPQTVSINYAGSIAGVLGPQFSRSDTSTGMTRVAHVKFRPPRDSQASQWQATDVTGIGTNTLFKITIPNGTTIDVSLELAVPAVVRSSVNNFSVSAGVSSTIYYLALDNAAGGSGSSASNLIPADLSLPTTA